MILLKEIVSDSTTLAEGLKKNGKSHKSYKLYTSMERALGLIISGHLYLSNGSSWNDTHDRCAMQAKSAYAICLSCATIENIAMWMLYGKNKGKQGAMLDFPHSVITKILDIDHVQLGKFDENGQFSTKPEYLIEQNDYSVFISDVLYVEECAQNKVKLTHFDEHVTVLKKVIDHDDIFYKSIAWQYEKECRLVVKISPDWRALAQENGLNMIRIELPETVRKEMQKNRLFRSPVYSGDTDYGEPSKLTGSVKWE